MSPAGVLVTRCGLAASVLVLTLVAGLPHAAATPASILAIAVDRAVIEKVEDGIGDEALLATIAAVITSKLGLPLPSPLHAHFYESAEAFESGLIRDARSNPAMARDHARFAVGVGDTRNRLGWRETYAQAFLAVDWLVERKGPEAMRDYFTGKPSRDRLAAFQTTFGISLEQFADEFATYLAALVRRPQ